MARTRRSGRRCRRRRPAASRWSAPAAGGPLDLVDPGVTGFLAEPGNEAAIAAAVARLAADPTLRAAQGRAGQRKVRNRTWAALGDQLIGHYHEVLRSSAQTADQAGAAA